MAFVAAVLAAGAVGEATAAAVVCAVRRRRHPGAGVAALDGADGQQALAQPSAPPPDDDLGGPGSSDGPGGDAPGPGGDVPGGDSLGGLGGAWPDERGHGGPDGPGAQGPGGPDPTPAVLLPGTLALAAAVQAAVTFAAQAWEVVQELVASGNPHAFPFAHGQRRAHRDPTWLAAGWDLRHAGKIRTQLFSLGAPTAPTAK